MLHRLYIKDYALISEMAVEFGPGLNILTGETGAGKSIIIGALSLLLGERARSDVIRKGTSMAVVEGLFDPPAGSRWESLREDFENHPDGLLLRREVHATGRSRAFANDSPISNTLLSSIGDLLIDLHGQHAHQTLLNADRHLDYLDNYGLTPSLLDNLKASYRKFRSLSSELEGLQEKDKRLKEMQELLDFQVQEIAQADLKPGEDNALEHEERLLRNSERLFQVSEELSHLLYSGEGSVAEKMAMAEQSLSGFNDVDERFAEWAKECESARIAVEEMVGSIQSYVAKVEFSPEKLEEIRERLGLITRLKKKYGGTIEEVLRFFHASKEQLDQIVTIEDQIQRVSGALEEERQVLGKICEKASEDRKKAAVGLEASTIKTLQELGLEKGIFQIEHKHKEDPNGSIEIDSKQFAVHERGIDSAEFHISLNPGEDPKPLAKIASGGEISRIMLALKSVLAEADEIPILVFDEIDTGISGRIASVVGNKLRDVSYKHQVICITHLPQIASKGSRHFSVEKRISKERSVTTIRLLKPKERVQEIAKLIGGEKITESALQGARELLDG
jgi:DNA repair protein RecN (Recombination protein N)